VRRLSGRVVKNTAILLVSCPDQKGLNASIHEFIYRANGNTLHADEHQDAERNLFLMRVEWDLADFTIDMREFAKHFQPIADRFGMQWRVALSTHRPKVAIFVSRYDHCLVDLLYRQHSGELRCEIPLIISNHPDVQGWADFYRIPLQVIPVTKENKTEAEAKQLALLRPHGIDLIVLARYMQVLSSNFIRQYPPHHIINIHHSFLPAFVGGKPHQQAFDRGVKLIGATSHYVTEVLDDGPIIEQDVVRISHRDPLEDLIQKGRDLEKVVLSRAVRWHIENRILLYGNKTVIFD
jgi:formyltetrahydrofolate deformylase